MYYSIHKYCSNVQSVQCPPPYVHVPHIYISSSVLHYVVIADFIFPGIFAHYNRKW